MPVKIVNGQDTSSNPEGRKATGESLAEQLKGGAFAWFLPYSGFAKSREFKRNTNSSKGRKNPNASTSLASSISNSNSNVTENNIPKKVRKLKRRQKRVGFTSPVKTAKKQKNPTELFNWVDAPINVQNKFNVLAGSSAMPVWLTQRCQLPPKAPSRSFINLKFADYYNLVMQAITRKVAQIQVELSGEYLKILASTAARKHREITAFLKEKGEEFHAIDPY
ncbi:hypothetical protein TNCV_1082181 [Trichonephila clavipes]|nr:hypothetical protein TNCV_1082181 [Trichonephila clavipes]